MPRRGSSLHDTDAVFYKSPATPAEFAEYFAFRWEMLRKPLCLPRGSERDELENDAFHLAAYDGNQIVGVGRLNVETQHTARIRYMAVLSRYRLRGIGSTLLLQLEQFAQDHCIRVCWLYAREAAVSFYFRNGYVIRGEALSELSGLHHERMEKCFVQPG